MDKSISISLRTDSEGFLSRECPECKRRFRITPGKGSDKPVRFCPYCSYEGEGSWWTPEQAEYATQMAAESVVSPMLDEFVEGINRSGSSGGMLRISATRSQGSKPVAPVESETDMETFTFACCSELIRHEGSSTELRCIICGGASSGS